MEALNISKAIRFLKDIEDKLSKLEDYEKKIYALEYEINRLREELVSKATHEKCETIGGKWNDRYILAIGIKDHIRDLNVKDDIMKGCDLSTVDDKIEKQRIKSAYEKEMADLYILLSKKKEISKNFSDEISNRIKVFKEKEDDIYE